MIQYDMNFKAKASSDDNSSTPNHQQAPSFSQRLAKRGLEFQINGKKQLSSNSMVIDVVGIQKLRLKQLMEPFKMACEKIEAEKENLETLRLKKTKLKNKLVDVYVFLLRNPTMILYD